MNSPNQNEKEITLPPSGEVVFQDAWELLTPRELQVVRLIAEGHTNKTAGAILMISPRTVEVHRSGAIAKLGVKSKSGLAEIVAAIPPAPPIPIETIRPKIAEAYRQVGIIIQQAQETSRFLEELLAEVEGKELRRPFRFWS